MTTEYPWYQEAPCAAALTQGDIVLKLPVLVFDEQVQQATSHDDFTQRLQSMAGVERLDLVVVTQACDLENDHVRSVQLCPLASLSEFKQRWTQAEKIRGQNPSDNSWRKTLENINRGAAWNYALLNAYGGGENIAAREIHVVDFHEIFALPVAFVRAWLLAQQTHRLQLRSPYIEHLSQSFARYFMRVGLPENINLKAHS